jgi:hypothetical protein
MPYFVTQWYFYGALKVKPLVICFPYVSYLPLRVLQVVHGRPAGSPVTTTTLAGGGQLARERVSDLYSESF